MYKVIAPFTDLQDNDYAYYPGDEFPREGLDVSDERLEELAGSDNKQGKPLIKRVLVKSGPKADPKKAAKKKESDED